MRADPSGFTVVELLAVIALIGMLAGLSVSYYLGYVEKARVATAVAQIGNLSRLIDGHALEEGAGLPVSLAEIDQADVLDPWGRPYQYLRLVDLFANASVPPLPPVAAPPPGGSGGGGTTAIVEARKDGFLVPINSDYDLYSTGKDGRSRASLRAPESFDDVIRAADGSYVGLAKDY